MNQVHTQCSNNSLELVKESNARPPPILPRKRKRDDFVPVIATGTQRLYQHKSRHLGSVMQADNIELGTDEVGGLRGESESGLESFYTRLEDLGANEAFEDLHAHRCVTNTPRMSRTNAEKRAITAARWNELIPTLIAPYTKFMASKGSGDALPTNDRKCQGGNCKGPSGKGLKVMCVYMKRTLLYLAIPLFQHIYIDNPLISVDIEELKLDICSCNPAAIQLLERGLFPSSPVLPSLAVEIHQLELVSIFFMTTAPNVTGWTETLETFLANRGYNLNNRVSSHL
jgi:hypothetical protein